MADQTPSGPSPSGPATNPPTGSGTATGGAPAAPKKSSGMPTWGWIAIAVAVVVVLIGGYYYFTRVPEVKVPPITGLTKTQAEAVLQKVGLKLGKASEVPTLAVAPGTITSQTPRPGISVKEGTFIEYGVASVASVKVPSVVAQTQSDAVTTLAEQGLRSGTITYVYDSAAQAGYVTAQDPTASTEATVGSAVNLTISKGPKQGQVPNVIGLSQDDANSVITADGFKTVTTKAQSTSVPAGNVISQSPAAGVVTAAGSNVTIIVSTGPPPSTSTTPPSTTTTPSNSTAPPSNTTAPPSNSTAPPSNTTAPPSNTTAPPSTTTPGTKPTPPKPTAGEVPDVVGLGVLDAVTTLRKASFHVSFAFGPADSGGILKVISQDPLSGTTTDPGSTVTITIGLPSLSLPGGQPTTPTPMPVQQPTKPTATVPTPQPTAPQPTPAPAPAPAPAPTPKPTPTPPSSTSTTP